LEDRVMLRRATMDDAADVLRWRNDPQSVAASKIGAVDPVAHERWFPRAIVSQDCVLLTAMDGDERLGMVRFDRHAGHWLVSVVVDSAHRNQGHGGRMLAAAVDYIGDVPLLAEIRPDNRGSIRIFETCGFRLRGTKDGFQQWLLPAAFQIGCVEAHDFVRAPFLLGIVSSLRLFVIPPARRHVASNVPVPLVPELLRQLMFGDALRQLFVRQPEGGFLRQFRSNELGQALQEGVSIHA
jgi:RimJ/RimL family protein N-acetyltransferase